MLEGRGGDGIVAVEWGIIGYGFRALWLFFFFLFLYCPLYCHEPHFLCISFVILNHSEV